MKNVLFVALALIAISLYSNAQEPDSPKVVLHDTTVSPAPGPIIPADKIGNVPVPAWAQTVIIALGTILPSIQLVLKRIPTATSVKIQGILGKVLDALTFFQKDKSTAVSPSAPPPVQNGVEKPALKDLQNHA